MVTNCDTCGASSSQRALHTLAELGFGQQGTDRALQLCDRCLHGREAHRWENAQPEATRLLDALNARDEPPPGRYSYLGEPDGPIHLMRLQPEWVDAHARGQA